MPLFAILGFPDRLVDDHAFFALSSFRHITNSRVVAFFIVRFPHWLEDRVALFTLGCLDDRFGDRVAPLTHFRFPDRFLNVDGLLFHDGFVLQAIGRHLLRLANRLLDDPVLLAHLSRAMAVPHTATVMAAIKKGTRVFIDNLTSPHTTKTRTLTTYKLPQLTDASLECVIVCKANDNACASARSTSSVQNKGANPQIPKFSDCEAPYVQSIYYTIAYGHKKILKFLGRRCRGPIFPETRNLRWLHDLQLQVFPVVTNCLIVRVPPTGPLSGIILSGIIHVGCDALRKVPILDQPISSAITVCFGPGDETSK